MTPDQLLILLFATPLVVGASSLLYWSARMLVTARYAKEERLEAEKTYKQIMGEMAGQAPASFDFSRVS